MVQAKLPPPLDRDLAALSPEARWREWMGRVEAVIFASPAPVPRAVLARVVGDACRLDALIADIRAELAGRPYDLVPVTGGWHHRTRPRFAAAIRAGQAGPAGMAALSPAALSPADVLLLAAIAYHQPVLRRDLERLLGRAVDADAIGRLRAAGLVARGPRSPRPGAPLTFVTTDGFLDRFSLESLGDLPDIDDLRTLGLASSTSPASTPADGLLDGTPAGAPAKRP